jgi:threonylcarbamoyladenosine tRNA methylthiotransferase MtaB
MKYSVVTFGCRVNQADSLGFEEELCRRGATPASPESADVVVVNTCSVTSSADQGARQTIRRIARENPNAKIVVTGCYATRRPEEVRGLPHVVDVVANDDKSGLVGLLTLDESLTTAERFGSGEGACGAPVAPGLGGRTAFTLRVQTGCAESCSYCIIPSTRGIPRSLSTHDILRQTARVASAGFKEIVLTGVHLGSYGRDLNPRGSLADLLRAVADQPLPDDTLFRVSSLEPMDCSETVLDVMAASERFAPHFHLPLQHASDRILRAMRRPYTAEYYRGLVEEIRRRFPDAAIGSDVIVGFPGETDDDFERLTAFLKRSPLTHIHVFPYSDRPGTAAAKLPDRVDGRVIRDRGRIIREISATLSREFRDRQIGTTHRALTLDDGASAVTGNYLKVRIPRNQPRNVWVKVRLISHHDGELLAG